MPLAQPFLALRPRRRPMPRTQSLCGCDDGAAGLAAQQGALVCSLEGCTCVQVSGGQCAKGVRCASVLPHAAQPQLQSPAHASCDDVVGACQLP